MKRTFLIIFCISAILTLGYTAYAATTKNTTAKASSKAAQSLPERLTNLRNQQIKNFTNKFAELLSPEDKKTLLDDEKPGLLMISKINLLNAYFNFIQRQPQDKKVIVKNNKTKPVIKQPLLVSNEFVHTVVNATSTKVIQDMQREFMQKSSLHLKSTSTSPDKLRKMSLHPAVHAQRIVKKDVATTTEEIATSAVSSTSTTTETQ